MREFETQHVNTWNTTTIYETMAKINPFQKKNVSSESVYVVIQCSLVGFNLEDATRIWCTKICTYLKGIGDDWSQKVAQNSL